MGDPVLVVGGYGHVGRSVAESLLRRGRSVVVAGRNQAAAELAAARLGCSAAHVDLDDPRTWDAALSRARQVLLCVDAPDESFAQAALGHGVDYVDITAGDEHFRRVETLDAAARAAGATAVLSVGLAPGLSNLLVREAALLLDEAKAATIALRLGLGDAHGRAAIQWMLEKAAALPAEHVTDHVRFEPGGRPMLAGWFDFADQHVVRRTLGLARATTWLTLESTLWTRLLFASRRLLRSPLLRRGLLALLGRLRWGSDEFALAVEVHGTRGGQAAVARAGIAGRREAQMTAQVAVEVLQRLPDIRRPGVFHVEQLFSLSSFSDTLGAEGARYWSLAEVHRGTARREPPTLPSGA